MSKKNFLERNEKLLSLSLLVAVIAVWAAVFLIESPPHSTDWQHDVGVPYTTQSLEGCLIEYGLSECIDGNTVTAFFNPGTSELRRVSMYFYDGEDVDIYNCREPLSPGATETLTTVSCTSDMDMSRVKLEWCCGEECFDALMNEPSDDLTLVRAV
jgi:hypothetical protein